MKNNTEEINLKQIKKPQLFPIWFDYKAWNHEI